MMKNDLMINILMKFDDMHMFYSLLSMPFLCLKTRIHILNCHVSQLLSVVKYLRFGSENFATCEILGSINN